MGTVSVDFCCVTNHSKIDDPEAIIIVFVHDSVGQQFGLGSVGMSLFLLILAGLIHVRLQPGAADLTHTSGTWLAIGRDSGGHWVMSHLSSSKLSWARSHGGPSARVFFKSELGPHLLLSHWPEQVIRLSSESLGEGAFSEAWLWQGNYCGDLCK